MAEKVTTMKLKVDLQCPCCYKKVKNILCKFPQIRDQVYNVEQNLVIVNVVCCSPEKIRDKLCCKGAKVIQSIEIVEKSKEAGNKPDEVPQPDRPTQKKPQTQPIPTEPHQPCPCPCPCLCRCPPVPAGYCCVPCSRGYGGGPCKYVYGLPIPPPPCYDNYAYSYGRPCYGIRCYCFREETTDGCTIM